MNKHARRVFAEIKKLPRPPFSIDIIVETSHGAGLGYGGEPDTIVKYRITDRNFRHISANLLFLSDVDKQTVDKGIALAQDIARAVGENYHPRGYVKKSTEQRIEIPVWALTFQRYSTGFYLNPENG
ncbi:hypothetical protein J4217_02260 [Candidatus Pacearchaeota archaeon]|nr:hypothetical protein [Candidatus Pacearchaeota archaeon]